MVSVAAIAPEPHSCVPRPVRRLWWPLPGSIQSPPGIRAAETRLDANPLIQDVVAKIQAQGNAEVERMRLAVRKAIAALEAAVGS